MGDPTAEARYSGRLPGLAVGDAPGTTFEFRRPTAVMSPSERSATRSFRRGFGHIGLDIKGDLPMASHVPSAGRTARVVKMPPSVHYHRMSIRILIVDPTNLYRVSLALLLNAPDDMVVVGQAGSLSQVKELRRDIAPDVVVVSVARVTGADRGTVIALRELCPDAALLVFGLADSAVDAAEALRLGAAGYATKDCSVEDIRAGVRRVHSGSLHLHGKFRMGPEAADLVAGIFHTPSPTAADLTPRQRHVLRMVAMGHTHAETAAELDVSARTVESHIQRIRGKLQLGSRAELFRYAVQEGIIDLDR